jgi:hypothetical protein
MPIGAKLTGAGVPPLATQVIRGTVSNNLTATGTTQAGALLMSDDVNVFTTVGSGAGALLNANLGPGDTQDVFNSQATNALLIYPPSGGTINNGTLNASISLAANKAAQFRSVNGLNFYYVVTG